MTMPSIYLSPSTQEYNPYITGAGSEEHFMNLIADAMEPYLTANTIRFGRNTPEMTAASSIRQGNAGNYDFYLALHSNAGGGGAAYGPIAFYYAAGKELAGALQASLIGTLDPNSHRSVKSGKGIYLLEKANCPAVLIECGFLSNEAEEAKLRSPDYQKKLCCCIAATVTEFLTRRESTDIM